MVGTTCRPNEFLSKTTRLDIVSDVIQFGFPDGQARTPLCCLSVAPTLFAHRCSLWETSKGPYPDNVKCDSGDPCTSCSSTCDGPLFDYLFHIETDPLETENLKDEMPDKFAEMVERFSAATRDEVFPAYKPEEPDGVEKWFSFNTWAVAWR
ncbi:unnamed protein product [Ectocarpus sp. 8 AP-2014]